MLAPIIIFSTIVQLFSFMKQLWLIIIGQSTCMRQLHKPRCWPVSVSLASEAKYICLKENKALHANCSSFMLCTGVTSIQGLHQIEVFAARILVTSSHTQSTFLCTLHPSPHHPSYILTHLTTLQFTISDHLTGWQSFFRILEEKVFKKKRVKSLESMNAETKTLAM